MAKRCIFCMEEALNEQGVCASCGKSQWEYVWNRKYIAPYTRLQERYIIGAVLGAGGFGVTYIGFDTVLEHRIAIKEFFPKDLVSREQDGLHISVLKSAPELFEAQKQAFRSEALLLSGNLNTPGICNVIDFFEENNTAYIAEEFLPGQTLRQYLSEQPGNKISWEQCKKLFAPVLTGLCHVHSLGIVHCDISPDNLMFDADGSLKLIDFGAARRTADETPRQTAASTQSEGNGSDSADNKVFREAYSAPEQYGDNHKIGPWTDLYALCAVLFLALTGEKPPSSPVRMRRQKPLAISPYTTVPQEIESAILQGMDLDIRRRYFYTGILMERLKMDTGSVKPLAGQFRNAWGDLWLEIFTQDSFLANRNGLFTRIRRSFTKDRLKHLLIGAVGIAGVCFLLSTVLLIYARTHPEQVLRFQAKQEQRQAARIRQHTSEQISSVQPGTRHYAEILGLLSGYEHTYTDYTKTTTYKVPFSFLSQQELVSGNFHVFPLKLALAEQLIGYYLGQTLTVHSTDGLCSVSMTPDKPLDVYGFVENSYSYHTANSTFATLNISYDAATSQVGQVQLEGYQEDITLFLRDVFPYFVPETYLTDDEINGLFEKMESDPDNSACILNHARFSLSLRLNSSDNNLIWLSLDSDPGYSVF